MWISFSDHQTLEWLCHLRPTSIRAPSNNEKASVSFLDVVVDLLWQISFLETRKEEVAGIRSKFPNSKSTRLTFPSIFIVVNLEIPVIVERYHKEKDLPVLGGFAVLSVFSWNHWAWLFLDKTKFLVPQELTMSQFVAIIR